MGIVVIGAVFAATAVVTVICIVKGCTSVQFLPAIIFAPVIYNIVSLLSGLF